MTFRHRRVRIWTFTFATVCVVSCSGIVSLRASEFLPADAKQEDYVWSGAGGIGRLTTPEFDVKLRGGIYGWTGTAKGGGRFVLRLEIESPNSDSFEVELIDAWLTPITVRKFKDQAMEEAYALDWESHKGTEIESGANEPMVIVDGWLRSDIPFRPKRVHVTLVLRASNSHDVEQFTFVIRS